MALSRTAARVISLAQNEEVDTAAALSARSLADLSGATPLERAELWYAAGVVAHVRGEAAEQVTAADRCHQAAVEADEPGWMSNALSLRAMALARQGTIEPALLDLARAEVALAACDDDGLRNWAHTGLGYCYLELRLYELALPHFEAAVALVASPVPLAESPVIDQLNLAELHLRWADELERAQPYPDADVDVRAHRETGHRHALAGVEEAERVGPPALLAAVRATELCSRPVGAAQASLAELRAAYDDPDHTDYHGGRVAIGGALARALWRLDRREEACAVAREAAELAGAAGDWQVGASASWLLVEMEAGAGVPGARAGRDYGRLLSGVLWNQRLSTLQGATAALDVERLHHDKVAAQRAASEDALTGVGNRRALDDALRAARTDGAADHTTLVVVDLDDFKAVNDGYGHPAGDEVLRAVARALRSVARADDLVARLGGDEFVVLARRTDAATGERLAARVSAAIAALEVATPRGPLRLGASVGVATTGAGLDVPDLLGAADAAMYGAKSRGRWQQRWTEEPPA